MVNKSACNITVLSIGPGDEHRIALEEILENSAWALCPEARWRLESCSSLRSSLPVLGNGGIPVVLCDADSQPARWREALDHFARMPDAPFLIVTSRLADDRLWSEALNLGAYDVLATPFDQAEVVRVLSLAWLRWEERRGTSMAKSPRRTSGKALGACPCGPDGN